MRTDAVIKNIKWGITYQFINMLFGFITPRIVIYIYGSEINGLQNSILQIINIISLLQAGVTSTSVYALYKPLKENNYEDMGCILHSATIYLRKIAILFAISMLASAIIFTYTLDTNLKKYEVFICFLVLSLKSITDMIITSKYLIIFTADQSKYIISICNIVEKLVYYGILFYVSYNKYYFIFMYIGFLFGTMAKIILYYYLYKKSYKQKLKVDKTKFVYRKIPGRNYSMINEISHTVVTSSIMVIVSLLYDFKSASVYSIYFLIISFITTIDVVIFDSFASSFGNLVASGNSKRIDLIFSIFQLGFNMLNTFIYMCSSYLIVPFVQIYTTGITDINYQNYILAIMIILYGITSTYRIPYNICVSANGFFSQTSIQPAICCIISIIISMFLGEIRMEFIMFGPIFFYLMNYFYQVYKLKRLLPNMNFDNPIKQYVISMSCIILSICIALKYPLINVGLIEWVISAIVTSIICGLTVLLVFIFSNYNSFIALKDYLISILKRRIQ